MFKIFQSKSSTSVLNWGLKTDLHSHLLPAIDDGSKSVEETEALLNAFIDAGIERIITTPHIYQDFYPNTVESINKSLIQVERLIAEKELKISLAAAAEYFLDESLVEKIESQHEELLTFGDNYLLFELSFINEPMYLKEAIFKMQSSGIKPILAHPERYSFFQQKWELVEDIHSRGVHFQINLLSLVGYYGKPVQSLAKRLIKNKMISFAGTDCHNMDQFQSLSALSKSKLLKQLLDNGVLNDSIS